MQNKFLKKFFPSHPINYLRKQIDTLLHKNIKTFLEYWDFFKDLSTHIMALRYGDQSAYFINTLILLPNNWSRNKKKYRKFAWRRELCLWETIWRVFFLQRCQKTMEASWFSWWKLSNTKNLECIWNESTNNCIWK